jgi:Asp-tRNA(Asn)/Glu-tRNA(Gln) amidotransferase A subunit family amidase
MAKYNVSALVMLDGPPSEKIGVRQGWGDSSIYLHPPEKGKGPFSASSIAALAGYPDLSVPIGLVEGLPIGMSLVGPQWSEQHLLSLAYAYEQAARARVPPEAYLQAASGK